MAIKVTLTLTIPDEGMLCDEETLRNEFDNDWFKCVQWFAKEESPFFLVAEWPETIEYVSAELVSKAPQGGELASVHAPKGKEP